jgi:tRNA nucleotidyltransferase (CCA-adding enzyme)
MKIIKILQHKKILLEIGRFAGSKNIPIWAVGGCVRDWYLKRHTKDIDLICESGGAIIADFICKKFNAAKESFYTFGTFRIKTAQGLSIDIARTRKEIYPQVSFADIETDLYRRDFTVNSAAVSILPENFGEIYDPFDALADIDKGIIKILHNKSFTDDPTRLFRAFRFAARFGWKLDRNTLKLARRAVNEKMPSLLSRSRIVRELVCILQEKNPVKVFKLLDKFKLNKFFGKNFKYTNDILKVKDSYERVGVLCCNMGKKGPNFLKSLNLKREIYVELKTAVEINSSKTASKTALIKSQKNILKAVNKNISPLALKPLLIRGADLKKLDIKPQKKYSLILNKIAKLQWQGKVKTKKQALGCVNVLVGQH